MVVGSTFVKIASKEEILYFQKFLYERYCLDLKWYDENQFPDKIFVDEYDNVSEFLLVFKDQEMVAGVRVAMPLKDYLPHEKNFYLSLPNVNNPLTNENVRKILKEVQRSEIMEITRFVGKENRGKKVFTFELMKALYWFAKKAKIKVYFAVVDMGAFILCHKLGFDLIPIDIPIYLEGSWSVPCVIIAKDMVPNCAQENFLDPRNISWI